MSNWQIRIAINVVILLGLAILTGGYVWRTNENRAHEGRVHNCIAINELSRKVYVTLADLGVPEYQIHRFRPTTHCEDIP